MEGFHAKGRPSAARAAWYTPKLSRKPRTAGAVRERGGRGLLGQGGQATNHAQPLARSHERDSACEACTAYTTTACTAGTAGAARTRGDDHEGCDGGALEAQGGHRVDGAQEEAEAVEAGDEGAKVEGRDGHAAWAGRWVG